MCYRKKDLSIDHSVKLFGEFTLERALCGISGAGFRCVELASMPGMCEHVMPERMTEQDFRKLEFLLQEFDLRPMSMSAHVRLVDKDADVEKQAYELLKKRIQLAGRLGARIVVTSTGTGAGEFEPKDIERFYENIGQAIDWSKENNITIALENDGGITLTGRDCFDVVGKINSSSIRINYDTANYRYYTGEFPYDDFTSAIKYVAHVHLKDHIGGKETYNFPALGDGEIDFGTILKICEDHGFKGPFSVESGYSGTGGDRLKSGLENPTEVDEALRKSFLFLKKLDWIGECE